MRQPMRTACVLAFAAAACWCSRAAASHIIAEGQAAPAFVLTDTAGARFASDTLAGRCAIICFVRPQQERSVAALRDLMLVRAAVPAPPFALIAIVSGDFSPDAIEALMGASGFKGTTLRDPKMRTYGEYGVVVTPSTVITGGNGKVAFSKAGYDFEFQATLEANLKLALGLLDAAGRDRVLAESRTERAPRSKVARLCVPATSIR